MDDSGQAPGHPDAPELPTAPISPTPGNNLDSTSERRLNQLANIVAQLADGLAQQAQINANHADGDRHASVDDSCGGRPSNRSTANNYGNISKRFKDQRDKYGGTYDECWEDKLATYMRSCRDYNLDTRSKLDCMHNVLTGDALQYFEAYIEDQVHDFGSACQMISAYFNSHDRQAHVRRERLKVRLSDFQKMGNPTTKLSYH